MKKITLLGFLSLFLILTSCEKEDNLELEEVNYNKLENETLFDYAVRLKNVGLSQDEVVNYLSVFTKKEVIRMNSKATEGVEVFEERIIF